MRARNVVSLMLLFGIAPNHEAHQQQRCTSFPAVSAFRNRLQLPGIRRSRVAAVVLLLALLFVSMPLVAQIYKTINYPGAIVTYANGINGFGEIVGTWEDTSFNIHGFLYSAGKFTSFDYPGAASTQAFGINNAGDIVGGFTLSPSGGGGFLLSGGVFTALNTTGASDINDSNSMIVGEVVNNTAVTGELTSNGTFTPIVFPNSLSGSTHASGLNNSSQVVGSYLDSNSRGHGFFFSAGLFVTFDDPGQFSTTPYGVNDYEEVVGEYDSQAGALHAFKEAGGTWVSFDYPAAGVTETKANHVNNLGVIVGTYTVQSGSNFIPNGFVAFPETLNPLPFINQPTSPETVLPGDTGFIFVVNGTGFVPGSVVNWNGSPRTTTFFNSEQLTAQLETSDTATAGTASVTVVNPGPGGGTSNVQFFQIRTSVQTVTVSQSGVTAGSSPQRNVAADFNHDGMMDLAAVDGTNNQVVVLLGKGDGTFQAPTTYALGSGANPSDLVVGDFNNDGKLDLAVSNYNANSVSILLGNGDGTFTLKGSYPTGTGPWSLAVGDFNGDGRLDVATVNNTGNSVSILLGHGDGTLEARRDLPADTDPRPIAVGDFNGDGNLDLAVGNFGNFGGNTVSVFLGNGDGTFQSKVDYAANGAPLSVVAADLNGDGKLDLAVADSCGDSSTCGRPGLVSVLLGNGDGTFQTHVDYPAGFFPYTIIAGDFNGDDTIDLAVTDLDSDMVTILFGGGSGTFPTAAQIPLNGRGVGLLAADFNGDGRLDFVVGTGSSSILVLLQNEAPPLGVASLTLSPSAVLGVTSATGTVTLSGPAPTGGAIVSLSSDNTAVAAVPGSVTVAAAATSATFTVTSQPVAATTLANITAAYNSSSQTAALTVQAAVATVVSVNPSAVLGGSSTNGMVTLSGPAPSGATITLSSSNPAVASVPASVTPSGTTATFAVSTQAVASTTTVTISATYGGSTVSTSLTIQPAVLLSLTLSPTSLSGGANSVATATLSGAAPAGGTVVTLTSNNPSVAAVSGNITLAAGSTTGTATITTQVVAANTSVNISATLNGVTLTATLTVKAPALASMTLAPVSVTGGGTSTATITLTGQAPAAGAVITLSSSNSAVASLPGSVTVLGGATTARVTVQTQPVAATTPVNLSATFGAVIKTARLTVKAPVLTSLTLNPSTVTGGGTSTATVTLNGPAAGAGVTVTLASANANVATVPASVTVPAGSSSATATVTAGTVASVTKVRITAKAGGVTKAAILTVQ